MGQEQEPKNNLKDFQFDQVIKRKPPVKQEKEVEKKEVVAAKPKKEFDIKVKAKPVAKKREKTFKYGSHVFKNLTDLKQFLLLDYYRIEKHATKLLDNEKFIDWLKSQSSDQDLYDKWVNHILSL